MNKQEVINYLKGVRALTIGAEGELTMNGESQAMGSLRADAVKKFDEMIECIEGLKEDKE